MNGKLANGGKITFSLSLIFAFANAEQVDKNATTINLEPIIVSANLKRQIP